MQEFFKADNGQLSMARLTAFLLVIAYIIEAMRIAWLKDFIPDIPVGVAGLIVGLYGINKFGTKEAR